MEALNNQIKYSDGIFHPGIVSKISKDFIEIAILGNVHCEACHAKSSCGVSETETKTVNVPKNDTIFSIHEKVVVVMKNSMGLKAVFYGYVLPFILLFMVLFISSVYLIEWQAGLLALFVLIPYYLILYFNERSLQKTFTISVLKQ